MKNAYPSDSLSSEQELIRLRARVRLLTRALLFYAHGRHYTGFVEADWEAPDEPNWMCPTTDLPDEAKYEQMLLEDGGVAAAALRKAFDRKLTRYDYHRSTGKKAALVCPHHRLLADCLRCHREALSNG